MYCDPSVVMVQSPVKSSSCDDAARGESCEEDRSRGGGTVNRTGPSVPPLEVLLDGAPVEIVTSTGFSNLNSICVSELMRIGSGLVITAPPPPPAPAPITAPFVPPRMPPRTPPTAAPIPTFRAAFLPSDSPVWVNVLLATLYDCFPMNIRS